jgi:hypothetical protein
MSPHALFKADRAKYAPNFVGQTISSPSHHFESVKFAASKKASLICIFSTQVASRMCKPYLEAVELTFASRPSVGVVRVQFEENGQLSNTISCLGTFVLDIPPSNRFVSFESKR